jgi:serine/threonine-protein kinase
MKRYKSSLKRENKKPPMINDFNKLLNFFLDTLEFIHKEKIIHRDIKPENILIDDDGKYVLSDF